jgi:hypothetical protein
MASYNSHDLPNVYKQQGVVARAFAEATILNHGRLWLNRRLQPTAQSWAAEYSQWLNGSVESLPLKT